MRAAHFERMQSAIMASEGEPVTVWRVPPDRARVSALRVGPKVEGRAVFDPAGSTRTGPDGAAIVSESDQFLFRLTDRELIGAAVKGAVVERENGDRFLVDAVDTAAEGLLAVTVVADEG